MPFSCSFSVLVLEIVVKQIIKKNPQIAMFQLIGSIDRYFRCLVIMIYNVSYNPAKSIAGIPIKQWKAADLCWLYGKLQNANHTGHSWGSQFPNAFCWLQWFWVRANDLGNKEQSGVTAIRIQKNILLLFYSYFLLVFGLLRFYGKELGNNIKSIRAGKLVSLFLIKL